MKYFTQDLLEKFGSEVDEIASAADEEWEKRINDYQADVISFKCHLPSAFLELHDVYALHDAKVKKGTKIALAGAFAGNFYLEVFPESMKGHGLVLTYQLKGEPRVFSSKGSTPIRLDQAFPLGEGVYWMYDEVSIASGVAPWTFCHSILLSNGLELQLDFTDFKLDKIGAVHDLMVKEKALA